MIIKETPDQTVIRTLRLISAARNTRGTERQVLYEIVMHSDQEQAGLFWAGDIGTLARSLQQDEKAIRRIVKALERNHLLSRASLGSSRNHFYVNTPLLKKLTVLMEEEDRREEEFDQTW